MPSKPQIVRCHDLPDVAARVADRLVALCEASQGSVSVALSGGSTPKKLYTLLASPAYRDRIPWNRAEMFFGDERAVLPTHPDSNFGMAKAALFDAVPGVRAFRMEAERDAAAEYESLLRTRLSGAPVPRFDLVLLGIGPDGHTASLFPGTRALDEREKCVVMNDVPQLKTRRMTFTYPLLNAGRHVWVLAAGPDKRDILSKVFRSDDSAKFPILGVRPDPGELVWWLDEAAAQAIPS